MKASAITRTVLIFKLDKDFITKILFALFWIVEGKGGRSCSTCEPTLVKTYLLLALLINDVLAIWGMIQRCFEGGGDALSSSHVV